MEAIDVIPIFCVGFAGWLEPQAILGSCRLDGWCGSRKCERLQSSLSHWKENVKENVLGRLFFFKLHLICKKWFSWTLSPWIRCLCETWKYLPSMQHSVLVLKGYFLWICRLIPCDVCIWYKLHGCMLVGSYDVWSLEPVPLFLCAWLDAVLLWDVNSCLDQSSEFTRLTFLGLCHIADYGGHNPYSSTEL